MNDTELMQLIQKSHDLYTFITSLFSYVEKVNMLILNKQYHKFIKEATGELKQIRQILELLKIATIYEFDSWKKEWCEAFYRYKEDLPAFCLHTLICIDEMIIELTSSNDIIINRGPLNDYNIQAHYLYLSGPRSYLDDYFESNNIRRGRQIIEYDSNSLNKKFTNFYIVSKDSTGGYIPKVYGYDLSMNIKEDLTVSVIPLSNSPWFTMYRDDENETLSIKYDIIDNNIHNKDIANLIVEMDKKGVDIIVFPELTLNDTSIEYLKSFLVHQNFENIKLIFTGSCWESNINESYVLTRAGTIISKYQKKEAYQKYINDRYYKEAIEHDNYINLLDVIGLGRVAYIICYDYLNTSVESLCTSVMKSNIMFVSAYTNSTNLMVDNADYCAKTKGMITVLSNACAAADKNQMIAYLAFPEAKGEKRKYLSSKSSCFAKMCENKINCKNCRFVVKFSKNIETIEKI